MRIPEMPSDRPARTHRATADWWEMVDSWAEEWGISSTAALQVLARIGDRVLTDADLAPEQLERLIANE